MAAPKGNQFWKARSSHGRDPKFKTHDQLWEAACEYFEWVHNNPLEEAIIYQGEMNNNQAKPLMRAMTLDHLWIFLDISDTTWYSYKERGNDFLGVIKKIEQIIRTQKFQGASAGLLNPVIIARDLGLKDESKHEHTSPDGSYSRLDLSGVSMEALKAILEAKQAAQDSEQKKD